MHLKNKSVLLFGVIVLLISCSEDFLVKEPLGINSENHFLNEKGIDALLIGTYAMVSGSSLWEVSWGASIQNWAFGSVASDDAYKGELEKAKELVNRIRERADNEVVMGKVLIHKLPPSTYPWGPNTTDDNYSNGGAVDWTQTAANYKIGLYDLFENRDEAMRAVQWEQRLEFATEGRRFFDLRRWDNLPGKTGGKSMADILNEFALADLRTRPRFMKEAVFTEKDKFQPVPADQLKTQPDILVQRPEYK